MLTHIDGNPFSVRTHVLSEDKRLHMRTHVLSENPFAILTKTVFGEDNLSADDVSPTHENAMVVGVFGGKTPHGPPPS